MEDTFLWEFFTDQATMNDTAILAIIVLGLLIILSYKPIKRMIRKRKKNRKKRKHLRRR